MINDVLKVRDVHTHCPLCGRGFAKVASNEEHIFPRWLQHEHDLWNKQLNIPNFIGKRYKTVKIIICEKCNNLTYGKKETFLAPLLTSNDPFEAVQAVDDYDLAVWLGKIFWLLIRKSHSVEDFRTRGKDEPDTILPQDLMPGTLYLGMFERAFAMGKGMGACYSNDPPFPFLYGPPYSLYRVRIDERDDRFESFDFIDNPAVLGVSIRFRNLGLICLFDGGLHRQFREAHYQYLNTECLHPVQFSEATARIFYDGTVLHDDAQRVTYFWNRPLNAVIAMGHTPRGFDPYMAENHDPARLAQFIGRYTFQDPAKILQPDGSTFTTLFRSDGSFSRFAVTEEEIEAARRDPKQIVLGPHDTRWRLRPDGPGS